MKPAVAEVTQRIRERSTATRSAYLARVEAAIRRPRGADRMGCANVAHAFAAMPPNDKLRVVAEKAPNIGVVTAYNDMLSAHQPYEGFPTVIRDEAHEQGATVQVAGGVPAMCDGVTQGLPRHGAERSSRATSIALSTADRPQHTMSFDSALMLGSVRQDRARPDDRSALTSATCRVLFVARRPHALRHLQQGKGESPRTLRPRPGHARTSSSKQKSASYHTAGTCTFYGTANSNQMMMEADGRASCPAPPSSIPARAACAKPSSRAAVRCVASRLSQRRKLHALRAS